MTPDQWFKAGCICIAVLYLGIIWLVLRIQVPGGKDELH